MCYQYRRPGPRHCKEEPLQTTGSITEYSVLYKRTATTLTRSVVRTTFTRTLRIRDVKWIPAKYAAHGGKTIVDRTTTIHRRGAARRPGQWRHPPWRLPCPGPTMKRSRGSLGRKIRLRAVDSVHKQEKKKSDL